MFLHTARTRVNYLQNNNMYPFSGGLQIADYEGSPRRFGTTVHSSSNQTPLSIQQQSASNRPPNAKTLLTSPSMFPPRPGFPKVSESKA